MQNPISVFNFKSTEVRTVTINKSVWFVASDIAKALSYPVAKDLTRILDDDETGRHNVPTPSGDQDMTIINESGLYHAVLKSRKPEAKPFRKWVTSEVLPAIRKTGKYEVAPYSVNPTDKLTIEQADILRNLLTDAVHKLPKEKQAGAMIKGWSKLKAHFKVGYRDIPQCDFTEAVSLVARHLIEGEFLPARKEDAIESAALSELTRPGRKFLTVFWRDKETGEINPVITSLPEDGVYLAPKEFADYIGDAGGMVSRQMLPAIINSAAARLAR